MKLSLSLTTILASLLAAGTSLAVPASITAPVDGPVRIGSTAVNGTWVFNQHRTGYHTSSGGIGGANDTLAWDANRYEVGNNNADLGQSVYAIADGYIDTSLSWGGYTCNQVLLRHVDGSGNTYYSGYLHMTNIITKTNNAFVRAGTVIGRVGRTGATNDHLHFAVYDMVGGKLTSRNTAIQQRYTQPPVTPPWGLSAAPSQGSVLLNWASVGVTDAAFRIHVSTSMSGWTATNGWDPSDNRQPSSQVPVNVGITGGTASQYTWAAGSASAYAAPAASTTYYWSMRFNITGRGASQFTQPMSFTTPAGPINPPINPPITSDDHGNTTGSATTLAMNSSQNGSIETNGDVDYFRVEVGSAGNCTFSSTGNTDVVGDLYDANGSLLASNDDSNGTNNFTIARVMNAGTYFIRVRGFGSTIGSYGVAVSGQGNPPQPPTTGDDHGNTTGSATSLAINSSLTGNIETAGDVDYFRIAVYAAGNFTFLSTGNSDVVGDLYDANGTLLASNDDSNGTNNFTINSAISGGTYYLRVRGFGSVTGAYGVQVNGNSNPPQPPTSSDDHGNTQSSATTMQRSNAIGGRIETIGDVDFFRFDQYYYGNVTFASSGTTDVVGDLYNSSGSIIASNDDSNGTNNFTIASYLAPGTYYVRVRGFGSTTGSYTVTAQ